MLYLIVGTWSAQVCFHRIECAKTKEWEAAEKRCQFYAAALKDEISILDKRLVLVQTRLDKAESARQSAEDAQDVDAARECQTEIEKLTYNKNVWKDRRARIVDERVLSFLAPRLGLSREDAVREFFVECYCFLAICFTMFNTNNIARATAISYVCC